MTQVFEEYRNTVIGGEGLGDFPPAPWSSVIGTINSPAFAQWTQMPVQPSVRNHICPFCSNLHVTEEGLQDTVIYVDPLLQEQEYAPRHLQVLLLWLAWLSIRWWETHAWLGAWDQFHTSMLTAGVAKREHVSLEKLVWQWWLHVSSRTERFIYFRTEKPLEAIDTKLSIL